LPLNDRYKRLTACPLPSKKESKKAQGNRDCVDFTEKCEAAMSRMLIAVQTINKHLTTVEAATDSSKKDKLESEIELNEDQDE
jgi:hypothetical protein